MNTTDRLLCKLKEQKGHFVSGESLRQDMGISRAAVNKHIQRLRSEGYGIESATRKGYRLTAVTDKLLPREIEQALDTKVFGRSTVVHFDRTDSTNIQAKSLASAHAAEGTLVVAEEQLAGRGRKQRSWFSPAGAGIYASLILRPSISPGEAPRMTLMTAVAAAEALMSVTELPVRIKWPNDLLIHGKKIGGILTEISTEMDTIEYVVIGLGINVNTPQEVLPEDLGGIATSARIAAGRRFSRLQILARYLLHLEMLYESVQGGAFVPIIGRWKALSRMVGQEVAVDELDRTYTGEVEDVDDTGVLLVRDDAGTLHRIFSADIRLIDAVGN
jgi:BirA family biotin operon repressor/biotin-[acetyl-CoA-carboxylase] ligase